jgi:hypothetical protein
MKKFSLFIIIFAPLIALSAIGCSGGGSAPTQSAQLTNSNTTTNTSPCGPVHEMKKRKAVWSYYQCNETDDVKVTNETKDSTTGVVLGDLPTARGMLSLRFHGLDNSQFSALLNGDGDGMDLTGIFFRAGGKGGGGYVQWQLVAFWYRPHGTVFTKMIIQRFDYTVWCERNLSGTLGCEFNDETDLFPYSYGEVYQFDCEWDTFADMHQCALSKVGDAKNVKLLLNVLPNGPYGAIWFLNAGKNATGDAAHENFAGTVSDFKFTVFE